MFVCCATYVKGFKSAGAGDKSYVSALCLFLLTLKDLKQSSLFSSRLAYCVH